MVISCNPDPDHQLRRMIDWYLDEDGFPIPERDGVTRYFYVYDGEYNWANSEKELGEKFNIPEEDWDKKIVSFSFISATIYDNPPMLENNPEYLAQLESLPSVDRAQLLHGNWNARAQGANYFRREALVKASNKPLHAVWARGWDKASQEVTVHDKYPDYTAGVKLGKDSDGFYYLVGDYHPDCRDSEFTEVYGRFRKRSGERDKLIAKQGHFDGEDCVVVLPIDPAAAGKVEYQEAAKKIISEGLRCRPDPVPNNKSKLARFAPFADAVEAGLVRIVESTFPNKETIDSLLTELEGFDGEKSTKLKKDDRVDAIATAFNYLTQQRSVRVVPRNQRRSPTELSELLRR